MVTMNKIETETFMARVERWKNVAKTLTQEQINSCAVVMGCLDVGWTKETIIKELESYE
jgi:hypothetical protein